MSRTLHDSLRGRLARRRWWPAASRSNRQREPPRRSASVSLASAFGLVAAVKWRLQPPRVAATEDDPNAHQRYGGHSSHQHFSFARNQQNDAADSAHDEKRKFERVMREIVDRRILGSASSWGGRPDSIATAVRARPA